MASSALDRRRINAPNTKPFAGLTTTQGASKSNARSEAERRTVRRTFIETGLVSHASGSAYVESSSVKVACAVYGPRQSSTGNASSGGGGGGGVAGTSAGAAGSARNYRQEAELNVDVRFATFATRQRKRAGKDTESPSLASAVRLALLPSIRLDRLPKATIDVYITVVQADASRGLFSDDEACAAAAATAASCALADAGIELYALVVGAHAVYDRDGTLTVDATHDEVDLALGGGGGGRGSLTLCAMPALGTVTWTEQCGQMSLAEMDRAMDVLQKQLNGVHLTAAKAIQRGLLASQQHV